LVVVPLNILLLMPPIKKLIFVMVFLHVVKCVGDVLIAGSVQVVGVCRFVSLRTWRTVCVMKVASLFFSFHTLISHVMYRHFLFSILFFLQV